MSIRPNFNKSLPQLHQEWASCIKCSLGLQRINNDGKFVPGEGARSGVMLIGASPIREDEAAGRQFASEPGALLRAVLNQLNIKNYYLSTLVACRSCAQQMNPDGTPMVRTNWRTRQPELVFRDEPPTGAQIESCADRLYEEIYLVDPVVIVGLGPVVCRALMQRPVNLTRIRGETQQIAVPGAGYIASLTEGGKWVRKIKGKIVAPVEQHEVLYHFVPTVDPVLVSRFIGDQNDNSLFLQLVQDLKRAAKTYSAYAVSVLGAIPEDTYEVSGQEIYDACVPPKEKP